MLWLLLFHSLLFVSPIEDLSDDIHLRLNNEIISTYNRHNLKHSYIDEKLIDIQQLDKLLMDLNKQIYTPAQDAYIGPYGEVVDDIVGYQLHVDEMKKQIIESYYQTGTKTIDIPTKPVYARVNTELMESLREKLIGHYITYFNSRNKERSHYIQLATEAIHNQVIFPGEAFSFNKMVGERTTQNGYKRATVIVKGELSEDIGGGICQVSSTLFNAVDHANLTIVERYIHSRRVSYVPPGRDATVSWYGPDFRFQNKLNQPILIQAKVYGGQLLIKIYSTEHVRYQSKNIPNAEKKLPREIKMSD
ncbi:hypothetical protein AJ85_01240 [Alkalihalobacillus alcalophilus ATCC 27647 = CGMCC 1.3604]|uniref:Peptidoglycan binding domain-containing protein n=1 Tax=Alkalihalobacillus alcalophilus ATCC 27647 = CGMCC 1.3604 TaxID=1218173 RepID=A0A094WI95_ALKAL|nr:VanW family protein [Alkalihalobacillus alcalophilus]KGA96546.1 hypothetical protein BALCAV_0215530 [Alkalihalobacillus alcalophilus ATCC 27647 = CGMCC 1.3604]MED1564147.1 VanW family protein [Alkalihalobacillus alcalophilus]THG91842.1 hypothetical protein AJ85_01240 [Alkalihalobacillus alcalophilus ATCC 27647 = CGMCC 1.3604]